MILFGLGLLELMLFAVFFILLVIGTSFDRRGVESPKWYVLGLGFVAMTLYFWPEYTFFGPAHVDAVMEGTKVLKAAHDRTVLWPLISSWSFWNPLAMFLGMGIAYSILEFVLEVRRTARKYAADWQQYLRSAVEVKQRDKDGELRMVESGLGRRGWVTKSMTVREVLADREDLSNAKAADELLESFVSTTNNRKKYGFLDLALNVDKTAPEPKINKLELAESLGAWTFFWPAYMVSLIIGDLLTEVFTWLAEFFISLSGRFVRMSFAGVFKF